MVNTNSSFTQEELKSFKDISFKLGSNSHLVQAAGGNTSIKSEGRMLIKASGTWLINSLDKDIFVEVDVSTGNANVGLVDPDAGAFAYTDEMKKDQLISSLEDEGLGAMGARARADEILTMREKAKMMKEMGKSKVKNKRQKMIDLYNQIIRDRNKKADGGEVSLTVIEIPDISGSGVETLFKKR